MGDGPLYYPVEHVILCGIQPGGATDLDTCVAEGCPNPESVSSPNVVGWTDGGAAGQFGTMVNGIFQAFPNGEDDTVDHASVYYQCPPTSGTVTLSVTLDDAASVVADTGQVVGYGLVYVWDVLKPNLPSVGQARDKAIYGASSGVRYLMYSGARLKLEASHPVGWQIGNGGDLGGGVTATIVNEQGQPLVGEAAVAYVKVNQLPTSNAGFGAKAVVATKNGYSRVRQVLLFYFPDSTPGSLPLTAHPPIDGATAAYNNTVPNWFYYLLQIDGVAANHAFLYNPDLGVADSGRTSFQNRDANDPKWPNLSGWKCFLGPYAYPPEVLVGAWGAKRLDYLAWVCRHEKFHHGHVTADWGADDRVLADDDDPQNVPVGIPGGKGDWLKDAAEGNRTFPAVAGKHGAGSFDPENGRTNMEHWDANYGDRWSDAEEHTFHNQEQWTNGAANADDWAAYFGYQYMNGL